MLKILIVDDHALVREGMAQVLAHLEEEVECVEISSAAGALEKLQQDSFDLAVVDLSLPDMNGFSLLAVLSKRFPDTPAIVVSASDDDETVRRVIQGGASGFVSKARSSKELLEAARFVLGGGVHAPPLKTPARSGRQKAPPGERYALTVAQTRVLELLAQGNSNSEIAGLLGLAEGTIKVHVTAILRALQVKSRAQVLVALARDGHGL